MKKKTIVFFALALLFLLSALSSFASGNVSGGMGCLLICAVLAFLGYRSMKSAQKSTQSTDSSTPHPNNRSVSDTYEFVAYKLRGVTFKNNDGTDRQTILRKLKFHDAPFDTGADVSLQKYEFDGSPAIAVLVNDIQVGNIPAENVGFLNDNFDRIDAITAIDAYGGGRDHDGKPISFGCKVTVRLFKNKSDN